MNLIVNLLQFILILAEEWSKISDDAKNLIRKMLTKDPTKRISASEAFNDPWI